ncbi:MAG: Sensory box/GGDEF family protein [Herbaspirillum sp.]|nr:Sensory box/GGDEF family protein [Herbaspirillum sp.]
MKFRLIGLGVTLMLIAVVLRIMLALPFAQTLLRHLVEAQQQSIATYVARDVDNSILARRALLSELGATLPPALVRDPEKLALWLRERQRINPLFNNGLMVVPPDGQGYIAQYPQVPLRKVLSYAETDWFQAALRADGPVMGRPQRGRASGKPIMIMAVPVRDAAKGVIAVMAGVVTLNTPGFLDRLQEIPLGASGGFLVISPADKLFVAATNPSMVLKPTPPPGVNRLHDRAMAGYRGTEITTNAFGVEELSTMVTVPSTGWFVVARMPTAEVFHPIRVVRNVLLISSLAFMAGLVAILMILLPRMLRPLTDAARSIREMADGKRPLAPLPIVRQDEVGDLALGFNYLVARLRDKDAALRESEARLIFMAHHDGLTGLYNRAMLEERMEQVAAHAGRNGAPFALLFCDLDGFKPINDKYGHRAGDALLCEIAVRLSAGRRRGDTVARFGGDEFVVLLTDLKDARADAAGVARQLLTAIATPFDIDGKMFLPSASIGIALSGDAGVTPSQLMSRADNAMYQAKREGKNRYHIFDEKADR